MISAKNNQLTLFAILAMFFMSLTSCLKYEEVQMLGVKGVNLKKFSSEGTEIGIKIHIKNPNNYKIKVVGSDLDLYVRDQSVGKAKLQKKVTIPKQSSETHEFILSADYKSLLKAAKNSLLSMFGGGINVKVNGHIKVRAKLIGKKIPITFKQNIDMKNLKMPF